jgi:putative SOS response-associated peptidase YedK
LEKGHRLAPASGGPFWLAGLWERWIGPDGSELETCCVLTTRPNALVAPLHERMPVLIPGGLEEPWLEPLDGPGLRANEPLLEPWDPAGWQAQRLDQAQLTLPL